MFSHTHVRSALLSSFVALVLLLMVAGFPAASVGQANPLTQGVAPGPAAQPPICDVETVFSAANFPSTSVLPKTADATNYPLVPGTQFTLIGFVNDGTGTPYNHKVVFTVTDLTKIVNGVRTWVLYDVDYGIDLNTQTYKVQEAELAFHSIDNQGNPWNLGEYPAQYDQFGSFTEAPDTWLAGSKSHSADPAALSGLIMPGTPVVSQLFFIQAYAKDVIGDCGRVSAVGVQNVCNNNTTHICYNNVTVVDEKSATEPGTQQKFYAPGVGNFKVGATDNDPQHETLEMTQRVLLSREACIAARNAALALDDQARNHDSTQTVYKQSAALVTTNKCADAPTATPTVTTAPTATPTATLPPGTLRNTFLPMASRPLPTPTLPPQLYDGCKSDPNPAGAANFPVRIVGVNKLTEVVTLQNVSNVTVSLEDWNLCSINGNQDHDQIFGVIGPGQTRSFPNIGTPGIWNDSQRDDAALYNNFGVLVSYYVDQ